MKPRSPACCGIRRTSLPTSLAFLQHSAGTTGLQKGVALTHAAVLRQIGHLAEALRIDATATASTAGCRSITTWD